MSKGSGTLMTDARKIVFEALLDCPIYYGDGHKATSVIEALTASGYRILAPGELDKETVERVARAISKVASGSEENWEDYREEARAAIRSLEVSNG